MRLIKVDVEVEGKVVEVEGTVVEVETEVVSTIDAGIDCYSNTMKRIKLSLKRL